MRRTKRNTLAIALAIALALTATACGGDDDAADTASEAGDDEQQDGADTPPPSNDIADDVDDVENSGDSGGPDDSADADPAASVGVPVPIARFAAHGPGEPNTFGPGCAVGVDNSGGDVFRFTAPTAWTWKGTSGGSSYDEVTLVSGDVNMVVTLSAYDYDTAILNEWQVVGPAGVSIEIDGVSIEIMEVSLDGNSGYAIVDLDYLGPMPGLSTGAALGTVALTSPEPGRPTLDEAGELLSTVRVERCAAVGEAMIWGPGGGVRLVPRFVPDPLGKTYPDQPQPVYEPGVATLDSYTLEQVGYLMPVEADIALCAAEQAVEFGTGNPVGYLFMFSPNGTNKEDLDAIVAQC